MACSRCGMPSETGFSICGSCLELMKARAREGQRGRCDRCGRPLISALQRCVACREKDGPFWLDRLLPLFPYSPFSQEILTRWKIGGERGLAEPFAELMYLALDAVKGGSFTVIPVPPRPNKLREKGWDQMEDLVRILSRKHRISVARPLYRTVGIQQKKLGHEARLRNLQGAIGCRSDPELNETVVIVDDLVATGSTLSFCAEALKRAGVGKVWGMALFYD